MSDSSQLISIDLVCGHKINFTSNFYIDYNNEKIFFCSEKCKKTFEKNPEKYMSNNYLKHKKVTSILKSNSFDKILNLKINGFKNENQIINEISKISGVYFVERKNSYFIIKYNSKIIKNNEIISKIQSLGYKVENILTEELNLFIENIDFLSISNKIKRKLKKIKGINDIYFNFVNNKISINYDSNVLKKEDILKFLQKNNYEINENKININYKDKIKLLQIKSIIGILIFSYLLTIPFLKENFNLPNFLISKYLYFLLATIVQFIIAKDIYKAFFQAIKRKDIDNNFLVCFSSLLIYIYSTIEVFYPKLNVYNKTYFEISVLIITAFTLYKYFIYYINYSLSLIFKNIYDLKEKKVKKIVNNEIIETNISEINNEDILFLSKDDKIINDVMVIEGNCIVDELFEENISKNKGEIIKGGSVIKNGEIKAQVINTKNESFIGKLNNFINKSFNSNINLNTVNNIFINYFPNFILFYSLIIFYFYFLKTSNITISIQYFSSIIAFSTPFVIPLSLNILTLLSIKRFNDSKIFPSSFESIYLTANIKNIIINKSILLKNDDSIITDIMTFNGYDGNTLLKLIASAENICPENNISKAILNEIKNKKINLYIPDSFEYFENEGFSARIEGYFIMAGSKAFLKKNSINIENMERMSKKISENGKTLIYVTINNKDAGIIAISQTIDEEIENLISDLNKLNYLRLILLSSDSYKSNYFIAQNIGIKRENVISELDLEQKIDYIKRLSKKGKVALLTNDVNSIISNYSDIIFTSINNLNKVDVKNIIFYQKVFDILNILKYSKFIKEKFFMNFSITYFYYLIMIIITSGLFFSISPEPKLILLSGFIYFTIILFNSLEIRDIK
ncbi:MAG: hypothetical protein KatS3mg068_0209 [Candidatus Sericytochromatia bacterium]|nr:MAG: hypothetical protein KatS3mg068_0209 [Candidatus Sericytochromatia bacterium]